MRFPLFLRVLCFLVATIFVPAVASASTWSNGNVAYVSCLTGQAYCSVTLTSPPPAAPSCATNAPSMTIPLANNQNGHEMLKVLLAAKAATWSVTLTGSGMCTTASTQEDIAMVQVH